MRELASEAHIDRFMQALGRATKSEGRVHLTGGATAVLYGWRESTIDVNIKVVPDNDELLRHGLSRVAARPPLPTRQRRGHRLRSGR